MRKGTLRYQAIGLKHWLRYKKGYRYFLSFRRAKRFYSYSPYFFENLQRFGINIWNAFFLLTSQNNINLSLNFLNCDIIEIFYFQLYFVIEKMMMFYQQIFNSLPRANWYFTRKVKLNLAKHLMKSSLLTSPNIIPNIFSSKVLFIS